MNYLPGILLRCSLIKKQKYDLILAGDVFVYQGDLTNAFATFYHILQPGGLVIFNTEINYQQDDFKLTQSGRFTHHKHYLEQLITQHHFKIIHYETPVTRQQNNEPVYGHLYLLTTLD